MIFISILQLANKRRKRIIKAIKTNKIHKMKKTWLKNTFQEIVIN